MIKLNSSFKVLNQITTQDGYNEFAARTSFNDFQRHEESLLYGIILSAAQREKQNLLFQQLPNERQVHHLFVGRYIQKDGKATQNPLLERALLLFGCVMSASAISIALKISTDVAFSSASLTAKIGFILTLFVLVCIPFFHLHGRYLAPTYTYLKYFHKL
ncbi:hypothetical protein [uncultured Microbulbifer sp.]|uniref:hypothetical protein n=1 Tax=uncultured Microbulbifer sp. TaxID=348147 RepID=UPI00261A9063|nr:hypothetical protein [uncultured Microbulbifer sp.]